MISAGVAKPADIRREYDALNDAKERLEAAAQDARGRYDDAAEAYTDAERQRVTSGQEADGFEARVRNANDGLRQAGENNDAFERNISEEWSRLAPEKTDVAGAFDLGRFYQWMFDRDYYNAFRKGILELTLENQNFGGAALLAFYKASLKMSAAILGIGASISVALELPSYFKVPDVPRNQATEQFARANAQANSLKAKEDALHEKGNVKDYEQLVATKQRELEEERSRHARAVAENQTAKKGEESLRKERENARTAFNNAADNVRDKSAEVRKKGAEYDEAVRKKA